MNNLFVLIILLSCEESYLIVNGGPKCSKPVLGQERTHQAISSIEWFKPLPFLDCETLTGDTYHRCKPSLRTGCQFQIKGGTRIRSRNKCPL